MEDLRTLVARALAVGDYTPAESARVRAVPDTRTIRYYTTLGLLKPPAQMRGRTALYNETHVLQIVAIKRLQAQDMSLSDIQRRLLGLTNSRLAPIAKLPERFWSDADQYLENQKQRRASSNKPEAIKPETLPKAVPQGARGLDNPEDALEEEFWLTPATVPVPQTDCEPTMPAAVLTTVQAVIELRLAGGVSISIQFPANSRTDSRLTQPR